MEPKFLADAMLGSLARWLRVMGHDTLYQAFYTEENLEDLLSGGRMLLSRNRKTVRRHPFSLLILPDRAGEQVRQMQAAGCLHPDRSRWFTRCLRCNVRLEKADSDAARENTPEHVFTQHAEGIRICPSCKRYYWPGSHRERMITWLEEWIA
ncbi:MAG: hypothetical protein JXL84_11280 [Deltaproteobacteria bacterium]|nr:hypothetical protein [Deltaproteobacteria bacterium]